MTTRCLLAMLFIAIFLCASATAQTTAFSHQGSLRDGANLANGNYDFEFKLFDAASGGTQQGSTAQRLNVVVTNGIFSVSLDFGAAALPGANRFLDIAIRNAGGGAFTLLTPRQQITSAPYSVKSLSSDAATTATNATQLGGVAASEFVVTSDPRMSNARDPLPNSTNYIHNSTSPQAASNFNINGTGTANTFSAISQFNIGASRVMSVAGTQNIFAGVGAGQANTLGSNNAFFGNGAGQANTIGANNTFFGQASGQANTGSNNAFFGSRAGQANTASNNAFFGQAAGASNTTGVFNAFFGPGVGVANTTGRDNSFFGSGAGEQNQTGEQNALFGSGAGADNTFGNNNAFFGTLAGISNVTGSNNTAVGDRADVAVNNLTFATAIGAGSSVSTSNTVVLGRSADTVHIPGPLNVTTISASGNIGIGTTTPEKKLHIRGAGAQELMIESSDVGGIKWTVQSSGSSGSGRFEIVDRTAVANRFTILAGGDVGIGMSAPDQKLSVNGNASKSAGGTTWAVFSDERLKDIKGHFTPGLQALMKLQPIRYQYKPENVLGLNGGGESVGFSAQAVAEILPEAVSRSTQGYLQLNSDPIIWTMLNGIKEQQAQIETQQKQLAAQAAEITALKDLICVNSLAEVCRKK